MWELPVRFDPKPEESYEGLLKQFNSLVVLVRTQQSHISIISKDYDNLLREKFRMNKSEIEHERAVNEQLTNEIDRLEKELEKYR